MARDPLELLGPGPRRVVAPLLAEPGGGRPVAFDADGTLWRGDVGEDLLRYLSAEDRLLRHRRQRGIYAEYERRVAVDPAWGYAYAVEVMAELEEAQLSSLCRDFFRRRFQGRLFAFAKALLPALADRGYAVWIVSASPLWIVAAGAESLGVERERVIAVRCPVVEGRLTGEVERPVPCGEGKVDLLRARGLRPVLAVGNGDLDLPMLEHAERALVVAPHGDAGNALVRAALDRRWPIQRG